jgi:DnaJ-class molecular chaperone
MSDMCFDDFDYDRHSDNCECEECRAELVESAQHNVQQANTAICPTCNGSKTVPRHAFDSWGALCPQCGGTGKQQ